MKIAVTRRIHESSLERMGRAGDLWVWPHDRDMSREELLNQATNVEVLVSMASNRIDAAVMDARPNLKLVANFAVGFNNIDLEAARARGIVVTNTPGVLTEATADITMALLLCTARRLAEGDRLVRRGGFKGVSPDFHLGFDLQDKVLGIYGLGRVGAAVARRALPFGLHLIYHNRRPNPELEAELGCTHVPFDRLLAESDFISINAPLNEETTHRFTRPEFEAMKKTAIIINTGRGPIIRESDLAEALQEGLIAAAGLDVYEFEPEVDPGLPALENVVLAPHIGSATHEVRKLMAKLVADNVTAFVQGNDPPYRVI